jgi:hypothetical protein
MAGKASTFSLRPFSFGYLASVSPPDIMSNMGAAVAKTMSAHVNCKIEIKRHIFRMGLTYATQREVSVVLLGDLLETPQVVRESLVVEGVHQSLLLRLVLFEVYGRQFCENTL